MKEYGIFLCCQSLLFGAVVIGLATVAQCADKTSGSFFSSVYSYIDTLQWFLILIPFIIGVGFFICDCIITKRK